MLKMAAFVASLLANQAKPDPRMLGLDQELHALRMLRGRSTRFCGSRHAHG